ARLPDYWTVLERAHGAKLDDAKRLLIEAVTSLHEEDRAWAVELDQDGDQDQKRRCRDERAGRENEIEDAFLDDLAPRERPARQLQARDRSERRELGLLEFVQDLFGSEMDFDRQRNESLGAAIDRLGRRSGQQHEDRVRLELADAGRGLGQVAVQNG